MSLELFSSLANFGTFVVIAATAVAAIVQLRHARSGNQIAALTELRDAFQSQEFSDAMAFVETRLGELVKNPEFRYQLENRAGRTGEFEREINTMRLVGNYFEDMGALIASGLLDGNLTNMLYSSDLTRAWDSLQPLVAIVRRRGGKAVWENFEYATMLAQRWIDAHPDGGYPPHAARLELSDKWLEEDRAYALTRVAPVTTG
jgi:hypothetical protein